MDGQTLTRVPSGEYPYLGTQVLTRPDWPTKHPPGTRARNLLMYILEPEKYSDRVLRSSSDAVIIQDKYPKAHVHLLVLPRWDPHRDLHPHDAFEDPNFLRMVRCEAAEGLKLATALLRKDMQKFLKKEGVDAQVAQTILDTRDFSKDFKIGIHAHPSQHELHVHIISRDMVSWHHYGARHYQAFNTPFLVPLARYPLSLESQDREVEYQNSNLMKEGFRCWRCGMDFDDTAYEDLQAHLREEWRLWVWEGMKPSAPDGVVSAAQSMQSLELVDTDSAEKQL